jgi:hypothetical protein
LALTFDAADIRAHASAPPQQGGELTIEAADYRLVCRLITTADVLEVAASAPESASAALFQRSIRSAELSGEAVDSVTLPEHLIGIVGGKLAEADPQADVRIALNCPACLHAWSLPFDIVSYLLGEIEDWAQRLIVEVHSLASAYGWSEQAIVAMTPRRRRMYLDLVGHEHIS